MRDESQYKICRKCGTDRPLSGFRIRRRRSGSLMIDNTCSSCRGRAERSRIRIEMLNEFGWQCSCCGEDHPYFLTLEHINGGRHVYGKVYGNTADKGYQQSNTYVEMRRAKREGWNRESWEVLCMSCNHAKARYGQCPHRSGINREQVISGMYSNVSGIGKTESVARMVEGGKVSRYQLGHGKLKENDIERIMALRESGRSQSDVAIEFGVSKSYIGILWRGERAKGTEVN